MLRAPRAQRTGLHLGEGCLVRSSPRVAQSQRLVSPGSGELADHGAARVAQSQKGSIETPS